MCECPLPHIRLTENRHTTFYLPQALGYIHCFNLLLYCDETLTKSNVGKESASLAYTSLTQSITQGSKGRNVVEESRGRARLVCELWLVQLPFFVVGSEFHLIKDNHDKLIHYNTYSIDE